MKKNMVKTAMLFAAMLAQCAGLFAETCVVDGRTWVYRINNGSAEISRLNPAVGSVVIPSVLDGYRVTSIGDYAFQNCDGLTKVTIPNGIVNIGKSAFDCCEGLARVTMPNGITNIGDSAFYCCISLTSVAIPNGVTSIGDSAFMGCDILNHVTIPDSVISIGDGAFHECKKSLYDTKTIAGVELVDGWVVGCDDSFFGDLDLADVRGIAGGSFWNCRGLLGVSIGDDVTCVGKNAFGECSGLTRVTMPDSITYIGDSAFEYCSGLTSVTMPSGVTSIGSWAFYDCSRLTNIFFEGDAPAISGSTFYRVASDCTVYVRKGSTGWGVNIPGTWNDLRIEYADGGAGPATYTVTFNANGGSGGTAWSLASGSTLGTLPTPTRSGYTFAGWWTSASGGSQISSSTKVNGNATYHAHWTANGVYYTVTFNANGGSLNGEANKLYVQKGKAVGTLPTPTRAGYVFKGWYTKKSGGTKITASTKVTGNVTYFARWAAKKYKVSVVKSSAGGTVKGAGSYVAGKTVTLKATPKKGFVFVKWVNVNDEYVPWPNAVKYRQPSVSFKVSDANVSVKAVFAKSSSDGTPSLTVDSANVWHVESEPAREIRIVADSLSYPTVSLSGKPAGLGLARIPDTDNMYVLKVTNASKMKPGVYTVKITAKNRAGKSASKSVKIVTPNAKNAVGAGLLSGINSSTLNPYKFDGGIKVDKSLAELGIKVFATNGWKLTSVSGLPKGLKWDGKRITGVAVKTGLYTVTFTMKKTVKDSKTGKTKTYTSVATATFSVESLLPAALVGEYYGFMNRQIVSDHDEYDDYGDEEEDYDYDYYDYEDDDYEDDEPDDVDDHPGWWPYDEMPVMSAKASLFKVTVAADGKITANCGGEKFSGRGFESKEDNVYYAKEEGAYFVKMEKSKKITEGVWKGAIGYWTLELKIEPNIGCEGYHVTGAYWYTTSKTGIPSMNYVYAQRNSFKDSADAKVVAKAVAGTRKFAVKQVKGEEWSCDLVPGGTSLSVVAKTSGAVTVAGTIGKTKVSGTTVLNVSEPQLTSVSDGRWGEYQVKTQTATARFFVGKLIVEISYLLEDDEVVSATGKVWKKLY